MHWHPSYDMLSFSIQGPPLLTLVEGSGASQTMQSPGPTSLVMLWPPTHDQAHEQKERARASMCSLFLKSGPEFHARWKSTNSQAIQANVYHAHCPRPRASPPALHCCLRAWKGCHVVSVAFQWALTSPYCRSLWRVQAVAPLGVFSLLSSDLARSVTFLRLQKTVVLSSLRKAKRQQDGSRVGEFTSHSLPEPS